MRLISMQELKEKLDRGDPLKLVNALGEWEYRAKHVPGSLHFSTPEETLRRLGRDDEIVVHCSNPSCMARAPAGRLGADQDHPAPVGPDRRQGQARRHRAPQPLVERAPVPGRARPDHSPTAPRPGQLPDRLRLRRPPPGRADQPRPAGVVPAPRRTVGGQLRPPTPPAAWYCGKQSPVHLFWHSFDLAVSRFSGRRAPTRDGADPVTREAYSREVISFGFWAGDDTVREPAFYSYTAPEPPGLPDQPLQPAAATWRQAPNGSMALLGYDQVRDAHDPRITLLAFLQSTCDAGVRTAGWDREELTSSFCPSPAELQALYQHATTP